MKIIIIGLLALGTFAKAQTIEPAELNTGGASASSQTANLILDYSIGNVFESSTVANAIVLSPSTARIATSEEVATLPESLQTQILQSKAGIKAWPVPSEGDVNLLLEGVDKPTEVLIYNQTGQIVQSLEISPNEPVLLNRLQTGYYFVRAYNKAIPTIKLLVK